MACFLVHRSLTGKCLRFCRLAHRGVVALSDQQVRRPCHPSPPAGEARKPALARQRPPPCDL